MELLSKLNVAFKVLPILQFELIYKCVTKIPDDCLIMLRCVVIELKQHILIGS
jgi:hypothetical protein